MTMGWLSLNHIFKHAHRGLGTTQLEAHTYLFLRRKSCNFSRILLSNKTSHYILLAETRTVMILTRVLQRVLSRRSI